MLRRDAEGRFELGHGLVALGQAAQERFPLVELARPILSELRDRTGESVQLFVQEGAQRRCVLSLETPHGLRWIVPEGSVFPLDAGSAGRVLSGSAVDGWVESVGEREPGVASVSAAVDGPERGDRCRRLGERPDRTAQSAARRTLRRRGDRRSRRAVTSARRLRRSHPAVPVGRRPAAPSVE